MQDLDVHDGYRAAPVAAVVNGQTEIANITIIIAVDID